jgi:4-amino-4-deoxy-L-arabinose transferase-like glycosyltransferase
MDKLRRPFWALITACAALFYLPLSLRALWDSDEGRYAEIAREMLELKDWVTPHLNYVIYFEKPPMMYWLTALTMRVLGPTEFAARFWCATFGLLTVAVTYRMGKNWKNERVGLIAGGILATSLAFFALTQFLVLDMALTFWTSLTLLGGAGFLAEQSFARQTAARQARRWTYLMVLGVSGGILTKGVVALVLPIAAITAVYFSQGRRMPLSYIPWRGAILIGALLTLPWFIMVSLRNPIFPSYFFIHEHIQRYLSDIHHRVQPFYFFIPVILLGFLPWTIFLPKVAFTWLKDFPSPLQRDPEGALWVCWVALVFFFFSLSHSKLVGYMAPVFPALALLVANELDQSLSDETTPIMPAWVGRGIAALILVLVIALVLVKLPPDVLNFDGPEWPLIRDQGGLLAMVLGLGVFILVGAWGMRQTLTCIGGVMLVQVLLLTSASSLAPELNAYESTRTIAERAAARIAPGETLVAYGANYENVLQSLPFYLRRRIPVLGPYGELALGQQQDNSTGAWFVPEDQMTSALMAMPAGTWGVTDAEHWQALRQTAPPESFQMISQDGRLLLFRKTR